ncbi:pirin family protein [Gordonia sp. HY285]|uniref:Pirin family protein n=1 Tax=Gordonia liuliyuniae TaxID=2911517 RepID=A0ABS9IQC5_9ACTN|nr:pirin family protein [Gordonia liuliyuniae]MCF8587761.1 pirin family protein [Gordonia liuliyuniae]MCF8610465.1 pirin family protein [Gordonia liuliyuniae]
MSNIESRPQEISCSGTASAGVEVVTPREVPLGGIRAMLVRRTLPTRDRSMVGAWCFADHYGPEPVSTSGGMRVLPHPHTGLQTVSWLFEGEIEHRDSAGVNAMVRPGEINLMSAGHGISHSEVSTHSTDILHGLQLWLALPDDVRDEPNGFQHHVPDTTTLTAADGTTVGSMRVFIGELAGSRSPVVTATPLLGAEILLEPRAKADLAVDPTFEHGAILDTERLVVAGVEISHGSLAYVGPGSSTLTLENPTDVPARLVLLGGTPFGEDIVMWWNFVGRDHDEIVAYRTEWESGAQRFGSVGGWEPDDRIPAPPLPTSRLKPRRRPRHE